jgi:hypothetical protein
MISEQQPHPVNGYVSASTNDRKINISDVLQSIIDGRTSISVHRVERTEGRPVLTCAAEGSRGIWVTDMETCVLFLKKSMSFLKGVM